MFGPCELASDIRAITNLVRRLRLSREFRAANRGIRILHFSEEAVAAAGKGFHIAGTLGGVDESLTDLIDCFVEAVVEIHKSICGPELLLQVLTRYYLAGVLYQHD